MQILFVCIIISLIKLIKVAAPTAIPTSGNRVLHLIQMNKFQNYFLNEPHFIAINIS